MSKRRRRRLSGLPRRRREPFGDLRQQAARCLPSPAVEEIDRGDLGFGGPIALAGYMQRDLVERRRWIYRQDYVEGLALAQLAPGPLAAQLAIYLGWVRARVLGGTLVSIAFIAPSLAMVFVIIP